MHKYMCPNREVPCPCPKAWCQARIHLSRLDRRVATPPCSTAQLFRQLVVRGGTWFVWVKVVGGAREAAGWTCDVHVGDICAKRLQMHPVNRTVEMVLETGPQTRPRPRRAPQNLRRVVH